MGEKNNAMCSYLAVPENFADFINGTLFDGRSRIEEKDVMSYDGVYHEKVTDGNGAKLKLERTRDVVKGEFITNYRMNLITLQDIKEENFKTGLKQLFGVMKRSGDKNALREYMEDNREEFSHLDEETFDVMSIMVNQKDLVKYKQKNQNEKGELNMCKAIDDIREEGREVGREEGELKLGLLITRLLADDRTEDVKRAAEDENTRKELYIEYGIVN